MPFDPDDFLRVHGPSEAVRATRAQPQHWNQYADALAQAAKLSDLQSPVNLIGVTTDSGSPPGSGTTIGDAWVRDGTIWVWNGSTWTNQGTFQGETGATGATGAQGPRGTQGEQGLTEEEIEDAIADAIAAEPTVVAAAEAAVDATGLATRLDPGSAGDYRTALSWEEDGTPSFAGIPVSPLLFGAVGDGVTDDSAALAAYLDALGIGVAGSNVGNGLGVILDGHNRSYLITEPVLISRCWFITMRNFTFVVGAPIEAGLDLYGVSYATFENILVRGQAWSAVNTCEYPFRLESAQLDPGAAKPVTAGLSFINCSVLDVKHKVAFAVGMNSANLQVSETKFFSCQATGQYVLASPDATWYQAGWHFGSGTSGNILNHSAFGCDANSYKYPVHVDNTDLKWWGGAIQGGESAVLHASSLNLIVSGVRSEGSKRLLDTSSGTNSTPTILIQNVRFDCNELDADGYVIRMHYRSLLRVDGLSIGAVTSPATPQIRFNHATVMMGHISGVDCIGTSVEDFLSYTGGTPHGVIVGYSELSYDGATVTTTPGPVLISQTALQMLTPGNPIDGNLYRKTSLGYPFTDYRFGSALGFDVRAAATYDQSFRTFVGGDSVARLIIDGDGALEWGPGGAGASDIKLERTGNSVLSLGADDVLKTGQSITASRPNAVTVGKGATFYDTTLNKPIWSDGAVWKDAAGTTV